MWHRGMTVQQSETAGRALAWEAGSWVVRCFSYLKLGFDQEASLQGSGWWAILVREKRHGACKAVSSLRIVKPLIGASQVILTLSCLCLTLLSELSSQKGLSCSSIKCLCSKVDLRTWRSKSVLLRPCSLSPVCISCLDPPALIIF